jgi:membrane protease subunit HflC
MSAKLSILIVAAIGLLVAGSSVMFVDETEYAIITQFGEFKRTIGRPGVAFKLPLVQTDTRIEKRILASDAPPEEYLTLDKKRLVADPITRWKVIDALLFFKTVGDESRARQRLDDVVLSELRQELAHYNFSDIVGNSRGPLMDNVTKRTREKAHEFGIEVVDVRIKRADLPPQVEQSVFSRMKAERERQAKQYRSEGQEESDKITSEADKECEIILAKAYRESQNMYGEGDAVSTKTYADAYSKDPEFYAFLRNLQLYEKTLDETTTLVLSTRSELFQYLSRPGRAEARVE